MLLKVLTNTSVTGTGTVTCKSQILGGLLITTDNSAVGTVIINRVDTNGKEIIKIATATTMWINGPFSMEGTDTVFYSVTGSGCEVHLYEWVN